MLALENISEDEDAAESVECSDEHKARLQEIIKLLNQETGQLVQNAEPIRLHFKALEGHLPESVEEALTPAAFLESHRHQFLKAQKRLADRRKQELALKNVADCDAKVTQLNDQIGALTRSQESLLKTKEELTSRRAALQRELDRIDAEIADVDRDRNRIPQSIQDHEEHKKRLFHQARQSQKLSKPIPGSADDDRREIASVDSIRLRAIEMIQNFLRSV